MARPMQPRAHRLAYCTPDGLLVTAAADGSSMRLLSSAGQVAQFPAWSPDGALLATIVSDAAAVRLMLYSDTPANPQAIELYASASQPPFYCSWSPDGRAITFLAAQRGSGIGLFLVALDTAGRRSSLPPATRPTSRLLLTGRPCFWDWAPTADRLLVHSGRSGPDGRLLFLTPDAADPAAQLPNIATPGQFQAPGIAPGGRFWAYSALNDDGEPHLIVDGTARLRTVLPHQGAVALGWSPTRNQLAFVCPPVAAQNWYGPLQLLNAEAQSLRMLVDDAVLAFFWAPDGQSIAYLTLGALPEPAPLANAAQNGVYTNGTSPHPPANAATITLKLAVVEVVSGRSRELLSFQANDLYLDQFLPFFDQYALSHRIWAADSQALVVPVVQGNIQALLVVPVNGSAPTRLGEGVIGFWNRR